MNQKNKLKAKHLFLPFILSIFIFNACKKEILLDDIANRTDGLSVFDLNARSVFGMQKIPGVGYTVIYSGSENFTFAKMGSALVNENGQLINSNLYGGSYNDIVYGYTNDTEGNTYVCGATYSPELRLNTIPGPFYPTGDAYLSKLDKNGSLVWQIGYSDTANGNLGSLDDYFQRVEVVGDSIYCYGVTENDKNLGQPNPNDLLNDVWLVVFDKNGNFGSKQNMPTLQKSRAFGPVGISNRMIKCANDDIVMVHDADRTFGPIPEAYDTTCIITRYRPSTGTILWTIYADKDAPEGDINELVELANGDLFGFNSFKTKAVKLSGTSGDLISARDLDILENNDPNVFIAGQLKMAGDHLYFAGSHSNSLGFSLGVGLNSAAVQKGARPWLVKMDLDGNVLFSKFYDVAESGFVDILQKEDGNLQLLGQVSKYGTLDYSGFFLTLYTNGDVVATN